MSAPQTKNGTGALLPSADDNDYVYDNYYEQIQRGVKSEFRTSSNSFATLLGLDLRANQYKDKSVYRVDQLGVLAGDIKNDGTTDENVYALYGEYKQGISENLTATANLRYDFIKLDYSDYKNNQHAKDFNICSYRIGANYQLNDSSSLYTNYSTGFRAPTISQLYAGDSYSNFDKVLSNPDLVPEKSYNYELGYRILNSGISYDIAVFQIDREDFIMKSSGNYGVTSSDYIWDNIGGARHRGLELAVNGNLTEKLSFNLAYTYLDATYTDYSNFAIKLGTVQNYDVTGNVIPRTSKHQLNLITDYQATNALKLTAEVNAKSEYFADDLNQLEIDSRAILNLGVDYSTKVSGYPLNMFVRVDNVFDDQYYNTARSSSDRNNDGVFNYEDLSITVNPGTVFTAGASVKF